MTEYKRRRGDRKDGRLLRELDPMHQFMPYIYPKRTESEAFIAEVIDLTAVNEYLQQKNAAQQEHPFTLFHIICTALLKTVVLRPKLNRFIAGRRVYQRNFLSVAFVAKNTFSDEGAESLVMLKFDDDFTAADVKDRIISRVKEVRKGATDNSTGVIEKLVSLPRPLLRFVTKLIHVLDYHGRLPYAIWKEEPNYSTLFLSNLGSIKLNAAYHHLNTFGTNSLFAVIGEKGPRPYFDENGQAEMRDSLKIGITLDERIADGYYYANSIKLFKHLMHHPELLDLPAHTEVDYQ